MISRVIYSNITLQISIAVRCISYFLYLLFIICSLVQVKPQLKTDLVDDAGSIVCPSFDHVTRDGFGVDVMIQSIVAVPPTYADCVDELTITGGPVE